MPLLVILYELFNALRIKAKIHTMNYKGCDLPLMTPLFSSPPFFFLIILLYSQ